MNITFIGNCQTVSLCFFLQELTESKNYNCYYCCYGAEFIPHLGSWSNKVNNKSINDIESIEIIKNSDFIIYQEIDISKSSFSNYEKLCELKKTYCKLIKLPSIYVNYNDYDNSIKELKYREKINKVDITVSNIIDKFKEDKIVFGINHPTTFLFLEIIKELCIVLNINFFEKNEYEKYLKNFNFMGLPFVEGYYGY